MTIAYRVKDWDKLFEIAQSRRYKKLCWVALPNKHDGSGYRRIAKHPRATDIFTAWILILQVASKQAKRGLLINSDKEPITAEDLADKTGYPEEIFELAFEVLSNPKIGWLEMVNGRKGKVK